MKVRTRGDYNCNWIERFCLRNGDPIRLTEAEVIALRRMYDENERPTFGPVLSACIALLHICGVESVQGGGDMPDVNADLFSVLAAAGP
jgi:hypothetical protein